MDVQNGISQLEELLDIIKNYRTSWKNVEKERESSRRAIKKIISNPETDVPTPAATKNKRSASSPADGNPGKKAREKPSESKPGDNITSCPNVKNIDSAKASKDDRKKKKRPRKPKRRSEAVVIKPCEGHSYADVLRNLRQNVRPEDSDVAVRSISKTKAGAILLVMGNGGEKNKFRDLIRDTLKDAAEVKDLKPRATLEIQDLDTLTTTEEVKEAVENVTNIPRDDISVHLTAPNHREQRRAFVSLPADGANKILDTERIKICMTNCRVKYREETKRCFRCFGIGHIQWECKGPDRKGMGLCIRCGEKGHKLKECENSPKCCICLQVGRIKVDHLPGSRSCTASKQQT